MLHGWDSNGAAKFMLDMAGWVSDVCTPHVEARAHNILFSE